MLTPEMKKERQRIYDENRKANKITLRVNTDTLQAMQEMAGLEGKSLNRFCIDAINERLAQLNKLV